MNTMTDDWQERCECGEMVDIPRPDERGLMVATCPACGLLFVGSIVKQEDTTD
jgi:hypothetical protein